MRRIAHVLAACTAATMMTLATAASAHAAAGVLVVNGTEYKDPKGCVKISPEPDGLEIMNYTNSTIEIYAGPNCDGPRVRTMPPGDEGDVFGASIKIRS